MITEVLDKMLVEFGKDGNTEFVMSPNNMQILSTELNDIEPLEYKGFKIVSLDEVEENKIYLR